VHWQKRGRIYVPPGDVEWAQAYAFPPTPHRLSDEVLRLYVAFCDADTVGRVGYVDVHRNLAAALQVHATRGVKEPRELR